MLDWGAGEWKHVLVRLNEVIRRSAGVMMNKNMSKDWGDLFLCGAGNSQLYKGLLKLLTEIIFFKIKKQKYFGFYAMKNKGTYFDIKPFKPLRTWHAWRDDWLRKSYKFPNYRNWKMDHLNEIWTNYELLVLFGLCISGLTLSFWYSSSISSMKFPVICPAARTSIIYTLTE